MDVGGGYSKIDIGRPSQAFPVTPPCVRVRTRRFGRLCGFFRRAFGCAHRHRHFGPFPGASWGFTPVPFREGQTHLDVLPLYAHEIRVLLATPNRSGLRPSLSRTTTMPSADFCTAVGEPRRPLSSLSETRCRPPGVRPPAFIAHPPDLQPWPLTDMDFVTSCSLVRPILPHIRFLFVESRLCSTLPSDPASRRRPCVSLTLLLRQDG